MVLESLAVGGAALASGVAGFFIAKKMEAANYEIHVAQARAKAKAIEHEAELILSNSNIKVKEAELEAKRKYEDRTITLKKEHSEKMLELEKKERTYKEELKKITKDREDLQVLQTSANALFDEGQQLKEEYTSKVNKTLIVLERSAGLTQNEAKEIVLAKVEEQSRAEIAHTVRRLEEEAKQDIKRRVNYILAQATTRFAGEFAAERLINVVNIKDDELKGRIIGKEGRNIKTLEMLLGVDIIIDDTPNAIILSSFNLYRRAIATKVIELLVQDGRIQPARIEGIYEKVKDEFDQSLMEEGENIIIDLGLSEAWKYNKECHL
jgi:ribonuclease Y